MAEKISHTVRSLAGALRDLTWSEMEALVACLEYVGIDAAATSIPEALLGWAQDTGRAIEAQDAAERAARDAARAA